MCLSSSWLCQAALPCPCPLVGRKQSEPFPIMRQAFVDVNGVRHREGDAGKLLCPPSVHEHCMSVLVTSASDYVLTPRHMLSRKCMDALST